MRSTKSIYAHAFWVTVNLRKRFIQRCWKLQPQPALFVILAAENWRVYHIDVRSGWEHAEAWVRQCLFWNNLTWGRVAWDPRWNILNLDYDFIHSIIRQHLSLPPSLVLHWGGLPKTSYSCHTHVVGNHREKWWQSQRDAPFTFLKMPGWDHQSQPHTSRDLSPDIYAKGSPHEEVRFPVETSALVAR